MGKRSKGPGGTPVTIGFIVRKRWKEGERTREKTVSTLFSSMGAANAFRELAEKSYAEKPIEGEANVEFYATNDIGSDNLPAGL